MATVKILGDVIQGIPTVITLTGSTVVSHASSVNRIQVGTGYFYKGEIVDTTLIGDATVLARHTGKNSIQ